MLLTVIACIMAFLQVIPTKGQDIPSVIKNVYSLIDDGKYSDGYKLIRDIDNQEVEVYGDSMVMVLNYEKGACLFFLDKYKEAIPFLNDALLRMEKLPHEDCNYLELIYSIGSCYNHLKQYETAEEYFRRVIIRGNTQDFTCAITTQTLSELAEVYSRLGYNKLADICTSKISSSVKNSSGGDWRNTVDGLADLSESYKNQGKQDEEIETLRKIIDIIKVNAGVTYEDYTLYCDILGMTLKQYNRIDESYLVFEHMLSVAQKLYEHREEICLAYEECLRYKANKGDSSYISSILPMAVKYIQNTSDFDWKKHNLYEVVGNGLCGAGKYALGVKYLQLPWNGELPNSVRSLTNLGLYYHYNHPDLTKSLSYYKEAEPIANVYSDSLTRKFIYEEMGSLYSKLQQYDKAVNYWELVTPYIKALEDSSKFALHLVRYSIDLIEYGQKEKADTLLKIAQELSSHLPNQTKIICASQIGFAELKLGEYSKTIDLLNQAITLTIQEFGVNNKWLQTMYHNLGRAYMLQKDYSNALSWLNKSKDLQIQLNGSAMQRTLDYIKECEAK